MTFPFPMFVPMGCSCTPAYATGNRAASITVTASFTPDVGSLGSLVDGTTTDNSGMYLATSYAVSGQWVRFDFGSGAKMKVTRARRHMGTSGSTWATWKWQASDDASTWDDLTGSFEITGSSTAVDDMASNTKGYRYYRLLGVSGTAAGGNRMAMDEVEFEQCAC